MERMHFGARPVRATAGLLRSSATVALLGSGDGDGRADAAVVEARPSPAAIVRLSSAYLSLLSRLSGHFMSLACCAS